MVLLVEDDLRLSELVRSYLQNNGFRVRWSIAAIASWIACRTSCPDLIVLDLGLPGQNGFEVCKGLRGASIVCPSSSSRRATAISITYWAWSSARMTSSSSRWNRVCCSRGSTRC